MTKEIPMTDDDSSPRADRSLVLNRRALLRTAVAAGLAAPTLASLVMPIGSHPARAADPVSDGLDALLQDAVGAGFPGISLFVERSGEPIYSGAAGVSNIERQTPLKTTDRHRIYSITKTFTAIVTLQLVDEGVLSLDDTVTKSVDDPAVTRIPHTDQITLRQLLTHTSGIYDFADDTDSPFWVDAFLGPTADWSKVWTPHELLAYADGANHAPYFAPGESYAYSNTNYLLIGLIVEKATGHTFGTELRNRILTPLALTSTFFAEGAAMPDGVVDAYQSVDGQLVSLAPTNLSWAWTFGNMISTTADLARFSHAVFGGELLSPASFNEMFAYFPAKHPGYYEGIGLYKIDTLSGQMDGMDGTGPGANSLMMRLEAANLTIILINNMAPDEGATERLRDNVVQIVLGTA
jgi:D-alanyl-D-alanine carboxypeptidase